MSTVIRAGIPFNHGNNRNTREYEISDCLRRCHLGILEKKYGGAEKAHKAATIIQRCYRNYRLTKFYKGIVPQKRSVRSKSSTPSLHPMKSESYINRVLQTNIATCQNRKLSPCWQQLSEANLPDPHLTRNLNVTVPEIYNYSAPTRKGTGIKIGNNISNFSKLDLNNTYTQGIHILTPSDDIILSSKNKDNDNIFKNDDEKIYQTFQTLRFDSNSSFKNTTFNDTINLSSDITNQLPETSINNFQIGNNHLPNTMNFFSKSYANTSSPRLAPHRRQIYSIFQNKNLRGKDDNNDYVDSSNVEIYLSQGSGCLQIDEDSNTYKKINYGTSSPNVWVLRNNKQIENYQKTPSNLNDSDSTTQTNSFNSSNLYDKSLNCQKDNSMPMNVSSQGSSFLKNKDYEKNDYNSYRSDNTGFSKSTTMISTHKSRYQGPENGECLLRMSEMYEKNIDNKRKRLYRICLNFFNKKPDRGIALLAKNGFIQGNPEEVAHFFLTRRGLSRRKIGEFLGTHNSQYHTDVLNRYVEYMDVKDLPIDLAIRDFMKYFTLPGEAQQIDRIVTAFARHYSKSTYNNIFSKVNEDVIHILAFAIIILNTDLHSPHLKKEKRMTCSDFVKNTRQADELGKLPVECYEEIYHRIKNNEILPARDHVTQVANLQSHLIGKNKPNLVEQHRRLICYCRMNQYKGGNKKQNIMAHCRELFLFNDSLMIAKISRNKNGEDHYTVKFYEQLEQLSVTIYESKYVEHGIRIYDKKGNEIILIARTLSDQQRFMMDLKESLLECMAAENVRLSMQVDLQKFKNQEISLGAELIYYYKLNNGIDNQRDSGLSDVEPSVSSLCPSSSSSSNVKAPNTAPPIRRLSYNSLDSGVIEGGCDL
ncbi:Schizo [Strongyloides ratti]|uniref:Schizo n=1 Tax=Strongyloides ratti TaxID=34506 RepID=A0A090LPF5_STRRB|nr:Schizo [Strongyloides ratti]CEF71641.1 Schizo [Strongyloides ratti]